MIFSQFFFFLVRLTHNQFFLVLKYHFQKYRIIYKNGVTHGTSEHFDSTGLTIVKKKYKNEKNVQRPPHWSGWCLNPSSIEFWLHKDNRIHERLRYNRTSNDWKKEILYP